MIDQNAIKVISDTIVEEINSYSNVTPNIDLKDNRLRIMKAGEEEDERIMNLLKENLLKEIKDRTDSRDSTALDILIAAKKRVIEDIKKYQYAIKITLFALKPFYLITLIDLMIQTPEMF